MSGVVSIGVDVGGTKVLLVALDEQGEVIGELRVDSPGDLAGLRAAIGPALLELATTVNQSARLAVGLALPGLVDASGGLQGAPNLGANEGRFDLLSELAAPLAAQIGTLADPAVVVLENDATAAAFAEARLGAARGHNDVVSISIGTGIGAGIVIGGHLAKGGRGYAGEIGHMIVERDGPLCACGRRGCWEAIASGNAFGRLGAEAGIGGGSDRAVRGEDVVAEARRGDATALAVIEQYAENVAIGLVNACEFLDPEVIVLGGGLATAADVLLRPIGDAFERLSRLAQGRRREEIVIATLGAKAAAIGVALIARETSGST